jgi:Tfp pilus assembly protein PilN
MKKSDTHAFINQLLVYTLVMICFSGSVGLGTVWLRHQISVSANQTKLFNAQIVEIDRRLAELTSRIAIEQDISELQRKNQSFALGLLNPREDQIVRVTESPEERLAMRRNRETLGDPGRTTYVQFPAVNGLR